MQWSVSGRRPAGSWNFNRDEPNDWCERAKLCDLAGGKVRPIGDTGFAGRVTG